MSDDDNRRAAVSSPPLSCANVEAASSSPSSSSSTPVGFQELVKGETVSESVQLNPETEPAEANETGAAEALRSNDHEATKVKQRKCVQFTTTTATATKTTASTTTPPPGTTTANDDTLRKFIEGEEILDKKNPFKTDDQSASVRGRYFPGNEPAILIEHDGGGGNDADDSDTDHDDDNVFITKEEILRQSKYVKTYIKNPDKQLNYDKSVIQKLNALKAKGCEVRDVVVVDSAPLPVAIRPPVPAPRTVHRQSDRNNNNNNSRRQASPQLEQRAGNPKPVPRVRRDYAEVKVRIGSAEAEESLYDSNEVVQNALKFDSRFRKVEFGSQDDIDSIAERTEDGSDQVVADSERSFEYENRPAAREKVKRQVSPSKDQTDEGRKTTFAEDVKKSFSNTVKSADFRKYLQSKGLYLVPAKPKAIEAPGSKQEQEKSSRLSAISVSSSPGSTTTRQQVKPSVLTRFFQNSLFSPKSPNDPAYSSAFGRSSTPVLFSTQARTTTRPQPPARFGSFNGGSSLNKRSAIVADAGKPKVNFKQLVDGGGSDAIAPVRRPASVNDFERPKLRTHLANRSVSSVDSLKRPVKNAGVQVNIATTHGPGGQAVRDSQLAPMQQPLRPNSSSSSSSTWQQQHHPHYGGLHQHQIAHQSLRQRPDARFYGGSTNTVAPLYSEPLREVPLMVPDETDSGFRSALDNGYHIYEQTPDNLRRGDLVYGKIGYLSNTQLNRWHPQDRRSYSSMQEGAVNGLNGGTYGRLRPLYVSSPLSTQSTPVRRASDTIDREQILHRIYDFCRRSIRNSSRTSVHSNQTEPPLYQSSVPGSKIVPTGGSFPVERQRVQRVQSLTAPRTYVGAPTNYTRAVAVPAPPARYPAIRIPPPAPTPPNQHERNIENIYAFVNKKMGQITVGPGGGEQHGGRTMVQASAPSTLRRVTFSSNGIGHTMAQDGIDEADYVNIRGAPDGIQYRTTQC